MTPCTVSTPPWLVGKLYARKCVKTGASYVWAVSMVPISECTRRSSVRAYPEPGDAVQTTDVTLFQLVVEHDVLPMTALGVEEYTDPKLKPDSVMDEPPDAGAFFVMVVSTAESKVRLSSRVPTNAEIVAPTRTPLPIPGFPLHKTVVPIVQDVVAHTVFSRLVVGLIATVPKFRPLIVTVHNYIGHTHIGHNYIGHNYSDL